MQKLKYYVHQIEQKCIYILNYRQHLNLEFGTSILLELTEANKFHIVGIVRDGKVNFSNSNLSLFLNYNVCVLLGNRCSFGWDPYILFLTGYFLHFEISFLFRIGIYGGTWHPIRLAPRSHSLTHRMIATVAHPARR